jgi:hypothetical protein
VTFVENSIGLDTASGLLSATAKVCNADQNGRTDFVGFVALMSEI